MNMRETVRQNPVLAILRNIPDALIIPYVDAVIEGGVRFFEVAMNAAGASRQIELLRHNYGNSILVGAGTAVTQEKAREALSAGAQFLLAPSAPVSVLAYCEKNGVALLPGVLTPTDVQLCLDYGFSTLKMFPAGSMAPDYVKSLQGPYDETEYVAIGGINAANAASFIKAGYAGVGLAGALVPASALAASDWNACTAAVKNLVKSVTESTV